jgi:hypothetical protein
VLQLTTGGFVVAQHPPTNLSDIIVFGQYWGNRNEATVQVRTYWVDVSCPFRPEHHWIGYTPAMRIKSHVTGNNATLYFECLWMDVDTNAIGAHAFSSMELARVDGHWLVKAIKVDKL